MQVYVIDYLFVFSEVFLLANKTSPQGEKYRSQVIDSKGCQKLLEVIFTVLKPHMVQIEY